LPSLFEARRRLLISATALRRASNQTRTLLDPRRDGGLDLLPVLTSHALSLAEAVTRGEPRYVRPYQPQCWFLPTCAGLPNRDADSNAPPPRLSSAEHSEDQRARVEGPSEGRVPCSLATISRACDGCMRFVRACRRRSPPRHPFGHPLSSARLRAAEELPHAKRTDLGPRSDDPPRREPPSRQPGCL